jgi:RimJ/RimL family protein N-acetyltransferase
MIDKMPLRQRVAAEASHSAADRPTDPARPDWKAGLPVLSNERVMLIDLRVSDAPSLCANLSRQEVHRFMSAPPSDVAGFERFIQWAHDERSHGRLMCFAVVPKGYDVAVGIMQVRQIDQEFTMGELGAALGSQFWGTGLFEAAVDLLFAFVFNTLGLRRLELRAAVQNGRANGAARKVGGVPEGVARRALFCGGRYHDQLMWSVLAEDWRQSRQQEKVVVH